MQQCKETSLGKNQLMKIMTRLLLACVPCVRKTRSSNKNPSNRREKDDKRQTSEETQEPPHHDKNTATQLTLNPSAPMFFFFPFSPAYTLLTRIIRRRKGKPACACAVWYGTVRCGARVCLRGQHTEQGRPSTFLPDPYHKCV